MEVLDHGIVELQDYSASDLAVSSSARVIRGTPEWRGKKDEGLIRYMLKHKHTSPFEHGYLRFYVEAPLFVIRQWQRHRTWSYNEQSGRYENEKDVFYIPDQARLQDHENRQNSILSGDNILDWDTAESIGTSAYEAYKRYQELLDWGIAREQARILLPQNIYHRMIASVNPHNLMHFLELRMHKDAQYEIREYANAMFKIWADVMPVTSEVWYSLNKERLNDSN